MKNKIRNYNDVIERTQERCITLKSLADAGCMLLHTAPLDDLNETTDRALAIIEAIKIMASQIADHVEVLGLCSKKDEVKN